MNAIRVRGHDDMAVAHHFSREPDQTPNACFLAPFSSSATNSNDDTALKSELLPCSGASQGRTVHPEGIQIDRFIVRGACLPTAA